MLYIMYHLNRAASCSDIRIFLENGPNINYCHPLSSPMTIRTTDTFSFFMRHIAQRIYCALTLHFNLLLRSHTQITMAIWPSPVTHLILRASVQAHVRARVRAQYDRTACTSYGEHHAKLSLYFHVLFSSSNSFVPLFAQFTCNKIIAYSPKRCLILHTIENTECVILFFFGYLTSLLSCSVCLRLHGWYCTFTVHKCRIQANAGPHQIPHTMLKKHSE